MKWTVDSGEWTVCSGQWTVGSGSTFSRHVRRPITNNQKPITNNPWPERSRRQKSITNNRFLFPLILLALVFFSSPSFASGEGAAGFYNAGNAAFLTGDFNGAVENYLKARDQGSEDARLFYNLGCAYLKAGKIGPAIQNFEMSRLRSPRDEDIRFNLEYARAQTLDELPDADKSLVVRAGSFPIRYLTFAELAAAGGAAFCLAFLVIGIRWPRRRERRGQAFIIFGLALLLLSFIIAGYAGWQRVEYGGHRAVIGVGELQVKSGPGMDNPTLFTVHEGLEGRVREVRGTWSFIEIPTGFTGWAPNEAMLPIG